MTRRAIRVIDRGTAAEVAGLTARTMLNLQESNDPPPWTGEGYSADQLGQWLKRRWRREMGVTDEGVVYDYETERARLTRAQADRTELEAQELRGDMVPAEAIIDEWGRMIGSMRMRLLSIPTKAAPRVRGAMSDVEASKLLEVEVVEALQELSDDGLDDRTRARRARRVDPGKASADPDGKRVGRRKPKTVAGKRGRARSVDN